MINPEIKHLLNRATSAGQAANEAMHQIDRDTIDPGVWGALYQQAEAIGYLTSAITVLADEDPSAAALQSPPSPPRDANSTAPEAPTAVAPTIPRHGQHG